MRLGRTSRVLFLTLGGAVGCNAYPTLKNVPIDCTADSAYDIQYVYTFDTTASTMFYGSGDHPSDADVSQMPAVQSLTDGARCGSTTALLLHTDHNNDWGSLFGIYGFGPRDESAYDGLSFWARAPGDTTKAFTILLDDTNTENLAMPANCSTDAGTTSSPTDAGAAVCKNYCMPDGGTGGATPYIDSLTGMVVGGTTSAAPPADACGNEYYVVAQVTGGWQFYTFPFANFRQLAEPNRVPNAHLTETGNLAPLTYLLTSALMGLTFRMPPEADMNLWLSHLGFYRPKAGGDGAVDAPKDSREQ
ncbi:MAG TPA: hypothetical protein VFG23_18980 [Polyangia bacterium]|nr:hypothetical protein [Polyangia bacterium]